MNRRIKRFLDWHARVRYGYRAPATRALVRCTLGNSVIYGTIYSDDGCLMQIRLANQNLITINVGRLGWKVEEV